jgi:hypothetical protein
MKIMCIIKINCPLNDGIAPFMFPPTIENSEWAQNFKEYTKLNCDGYVKHDQLEGGYYADGSSYYNKYNKRTDYSTVLLFDSEEELNSWVSNCKLTDPILKSDINTWQTAHGITFTYEYYTLTPIAGPDPVI